VSGEEESHAEELAGAYGPDLARAALKAAQARARLNAAEQQRLDAAARRAERRRGQRDRRVRRSGDPVLLGAALEGLVDARGWDADVRTASVLARWPELVGDDLAAHASPLSLRDGELLLEAESTAWATQLRLMARQVMDRLNTQLGAGTVTSLRVQGPAAARGPGTAGGLRVRGSRGPRDTYG
jgi:predicted nucleic acid-binding Zn ribbon protein